MIRDQEWSFREHFFLHMHNKEEGGVEESYF